MLATRKAPAVIKKRFSVLLPIDLYRFVESQADSQTDGSKNAIVIKALRGLKDAECRGK